MLSSSISNDGDAIAKHTSSLTHSFLNDEVVRLMNTLATKYLTLIECAQVLKHARYTMQRDIVMSRIWWVPVTPVLNGMRVDNGSV